MNILDCVFTRQLLTIVILEDIKLFLKIEIALVFFFVVVCVPLLLDVIKDRINCSQKVNAKIVDYADKNGHYSGMKGKLNSHSAFPPIYEYSYNGETYKCQSRKIAHKDKARLHQYVDIRINPNNPMHIVEKEDKGLWLPVGACIVTFILLSVLVWKLING